MRPVGHAVVWPALLLTLFGWVLSVIGLTFLQDDCRQGRLLSALGGSDRGGLTNIAALTGIPFGLPGGCRHYFRWMWFVWAFELLVVSGLPLSLIGGLLFRGAHSGWIGITATLAALNMLVANMLYNLARLLPDGKFERRAETALVGFAISAAANLLLMLGLGAGAAAHRHYNDYEQHHKTPEVVGRPPAGAPVMSTV